MGADHTGAVVSARKILLLLDAAASRQQTLATVQRLAESQEAEVELYDCSVQTFMPPSWTEEAGARETYLELLRERRLWDLERLALPLRRQGLAVVAVAETRTPLSDAVEQHLRDSAPDLIVKDAGPKSAPADSWHVQTERILARHERCPVVLVERPDDAENELLSRFVTA